MVQVTFNEPIDPLLVTSSNIYLQTSSSSNPIPAAINSSLDIRSVALTPAQSLASGTYFLIYVIMA